MNPYEENIRAVAEEASAAVLRLFPAYLAGKISFGVFSTVSATVLAVAMTRGVAIAELTLAGYFQTALGFIPPFTGVQLEDPVKRETRLIKALVTIEENKTQDSGMQLERLAQSELMAAASRGFYSAIRASPYITHYTRGLDSDPCELCAWLYKNGFEYPVKTPMFQHPGCCCHPRPVFKHTPTAVELRNKEKV